MPVFAGLVTGSASALTSYLSSGAHGMVVHVKNIFPYLNKDRLRPFEYKLDTIWNMQPHMTREVKASTWDGGSLRARSSTPELRLPSHLLTLHPL